MTEWKLVPTQPTAEMLGARGGNVWTRVEIWEAMLSASPEPPHISMTREEAAVFQDWKGMDGAIALHLIERHANGWADTQREQTAVEQMALTLFDAFAKAEPEHSITKNSTSYLATFLDMAKAALQAAQAQQVAVEPRGLFIDLIAQHPGLAEELEATLPPVEGDKLPAVGTRVFIHLARPDTWVLHTVVGYYVWPSLSRGGNWRVFVRVKDDDGYLNARALDDIRLTQP